MWKKTEDDQPEFESSVPNPRPQPVREQAVIGPSLVVKGDVSGDEDLVIQGKVEGKVALKNNSVTVGKDGQVKADLYGKMINVEGTVQGNLYGDEKIVVRQSGKVQGNLQAPRVTLEDGAQFKGSIDMTGPAVDTTSAPKQSASAGGSTKKSESGTSSTQGDLGIKIKKP